MSTSQAHLLLGALCHWHLSVNDDGWPSTSIFYRMARGEMAQTGLPGHKILCREMSNPLRHTQVAFNGLPVDQKIIVLVKHMPPPQYEDGEPMFKKWGDYEKASYLDDSISQFKARYKRICRAVEGQLRH